MLVYTCTVHARVHLYCTPVLYMLVYTCTLCWSTPVLYLVVGVEVGAREVERALKGDHGPKLDVFTEFVILELVVLKSHLEPGAIVR